MKTYVLLFSLFTGIMFISCSEDDDQNEEPVPTGTLDVRDQVYENGMLTIHSVEVNSDSWVAIYSYATQRGELLGYTFIEAGEHSDIEVELDENAEVENGETLLALLHLDGNKNRIFDWDDVHNVDLPLLIDNREVSELFSVTVLPPGNLKVRTQVFENNSVTVEYAQIMNDGWLAVYRYGVQREELLGYTFVEAGEHEDIEIELTSNYFVKARERLQVILHLDANKNKVFDWNDENTIDLPLKDGEREVSRLFNLILDGDYWITVEDQPLRSGPFEDLIDIINLNLESIQYLIESEKVWIVAYNDMDGSPGEEVGTSNPIIVTNHDKETIYIYGRVEVGDILWLVLHNDGDSAPGTMVYDTENEEYVMTFITIL